MTGRGNTLFELNKNQLLQSFQFNLPRGYHAESTARVAHLKGSKLRDAAVLIGFVEREQGLNVILTKRASHLKHHPGQISFPGGKYEESDSFFTSNGVARDARRDRNCTKCDLHFWPNAGVGNRQPIQSHTHIGVCRTKLSNRH